MIMRLGYIKCPMCNGTGTEEGMRGRHVPNCVECTGAGQVPAPKNEKEAAYLEDVRTATLRTA